jgi:hypothetical protein
MLQVIHKLEQFASLLTALIITAAAQKRKSCKRLFKKFHILLLANKYLLITVTDSDELLQVCDLQRLAVYFSLSKRHLLCWDKTIQAPPQKLNVYPLIVNNLSSNERIPFDSHSLLC